MDNRVMRGETYFKIINSTIDIIAEQGISGVSAAKISQGASISKSSVFHHFKSVDEILVATLHKVIDSMIYEIKSEDTSTLADILNSYERTLFKADDDLKKIERAFFAFYNESMFHNTYKEIFHQFLENSIVEFEKAMLRIGITKEKAKNLSQLIIAILDGLSIQMLITDKKDENYKAWLNFKAMVLEFYSKDK